jgi:hypothetical protein
MTCPLPQTINGTKAPTIESFPSTKEMVRVNRWLHAHVRFLLLAMNDPQLAFTPRS